MFDFALLQQCNYKSYQNNSDLLVPVLSVVHDLSSLVKILSVVVVTKIVPFDLFEIYNFLTFDALEV